MITVRRSLFASTFALLPLALAFAPRADRLSFGPEEAATVSRSLSIEFALYLEDLRVVAEGQEVPVPIEGLDSGIVISLAMDVADRFVKSRDGRAIELVRTYERISMEGGPQGEAESLDDMDKIVDKPVRFLWDADDSEYDVTWADATTRGDDALLEGLDVDMDFTMLLPDREVSKGDTWTVSGPELALLFLPGGMPTAPGDGADEVWPMVEAAIEGQLAEAFKGFEVLCTYQGARSEGDTRVGEITFVYRGAATIDLTELIDAVISAQGGEMGIEADVSASLKLEFDGTGALLWDLVGQRAHAMNMGNELVLMLEASADIDAMGQQISGELSLEVSGNGKWVMTTR
jgi:hypothetical protein